MPPTLQNLSAQRNAAFARSSSATDISINVRLVPKADIRQAPYRLLRRLTGFQEHFVRL
jgi:hypothetical protein